MTMFKYKTFELPERIAKVTGTLLSSRLHCATSGSALHGWYLKPTKIKKVVVCKADGVIVGAAVLMKREDKAFRTNIGVYVKRDFRRQGIGTELIRRLSPRNTRTTKLMWNYGIAGSERFYREVASRLPTMQIFYAREKDGRHRHAECS
jgi:GNAT superfamily N-acetyltransferase